MEYKRLPFEQYFIDQSLGNYGGTPSIKVDYKKVEYKGRFLKHDAYYCVLWNDARKLYQIYFKETCSPSQWISNFLFAKKYCDNFQYEGRDIQLKAARGWSDLYCALKWYIRNELSALLEKHGYSDVEIIGWSLGSAIAQLCAQDLYFNYGIKAHVFTFGSVKPWAGFDKDMRDYLQDCFAECWNIYDVNDLVGYMVPLPGRFALNHVKVKQKRFCIFRIFNVGKYHTEYFKKELYKDIK